MNISFEDKIIEEFDKKFYLFTNDYEIVFKRDNFAGSSEAGDFGEEIKDFLRSVIRKAYEHGLNDIEECPDMGCENCNLLREEKTK